MLKLTSVKIKMFLSRYWMLLLLLLILLHIPVEYANIKYWATSIFNNNTRVFWLSLSPKTSQEPSL